MKHWPSTERWIAWALITITAFAGLAMLLPGLAILFTLLVVTIPIAIVMGAAPTLWMYLAPGMFLFLGLRKKGVSYPLASLISISLPVATFVAGTILVRNANSEVLSQVESFSEGDLIDTVGGGPITTYVDLQPKRLDEQPDLRCDWSCERALFSGYATQYALGYADDFDPEASQQKVNVVHEIVPIGEGCDNSHLLGSRVHAGDFRALDHTRQKELWDVLPKLEAQGLCFRSRRIDTISGDVVFAFTSNNGLSSEQSQADWDWRMERCCRRVRVEAFQRDGDGYRLVRRQSQIAYELLEDPLGIELPFNFAVHNPGGWMHGPQEIDPENFPSVSIATIVDADLSVGNGTVWRSAPVSPTDDPRAASTIVISAPKGR